MRWRGLARSRGTVPPISQRPLRRSTTYQGQERSRCSGRPGLRAFSHQMTGVAPMPNGSSFPFADGSELSSPHITRGFPSATCLEVFPSPVAQGFLLRAQLGVSPPPHALKFSLSRVARVSPLRVFPFPPAPGFPRDQRPQSLPNTGWSGVSPAPVARSFPLAVAPDFSLPEGPELSFAGWLGVSPSPVTVPGGEEISTPIARAAQEVSGSNFKILWPSTSHPQLTPGCPPRRAFLHRILHRPVHRRTAASPGNPVSPATGSGRRT